MAMYFQIPGGYISYPASLDQTPGLYQNKFQPLGYQPTHWYWDFRPQSPNVYHSNESPDSSFRPGPDELKEIQCVRGTRILTGRRYYWEIQVDRTRDAQNFPCIEHDSMMFGITTEVRDFGKLEFWGFNTRGEIVHNKVATQFTEPLLVNMNQREFQKFTVGILFDGIGGRLSFFKDGIDLGVAFTDLHLSPNRLYPMLVSANSSYTYSKTFTTIILRRPACGIMNLQERCRRSILRSLKKLSEKKIDSLNLPQRMKKLLKQDMMTMENEDNPRLLIG